jgi:hypothetical protein
VRIGLGPARDWREYAGTDVEPEPGRALYQRIGEAVMRDIALLRREQEHRASRGAA